MNFIRNSSNSTTASSNKTVNRNDIGSKSNQLKVPSTPGSTNNGGSRNGGSNESEPRKMQAEQSALLKDLSQSKLLSKFKTEGMNSPNLEVKLDKTNEIKQRDSLKSNIIQPAKPIEFGGIYGADIVDSGVYGASPLTLVSNSLEKKQKSENFCSNIETNLALNIEPNNESTITKDEVLKDSVDTKNSEKVDSRNSSVDKDEVKISDIKVNNIQESTEATKTLEYLNLANDNKETVDLKNINSQLDFEDEEKRQTLVFSEENLGIVSGMASKIIDNTENINESKIVLANTTPRKTKFNPLHVKVKEKKHTKYRF